MPIAQSPVDVSTRSRSDRVLVLSPATGGCQGGQKLCYRLTSVFTVSTSQLRSTHLTTPNSARLLPTPCCAFLHCRAPPPLNSWPERHSPRKRRGVLEKISPAFGRYMSTRQQPSFFLSLLFPPLFFPIFLNSLLPNHRPKVIHPTDSVPTSPGPLPLPPPSILLSTNLPKDLG